jgi:hypothetical protein
MGEGKRGRGDEVRLHVNDYEVSFFFPSPVFVGKE